MSDKIEILPGDWVVHRFQLSAPTVKLVASVTDDKFTVDSEYGPIWFDRSGVLYVSEHEEDARYFLAVFEEETPSRKPEMPGKVSKTVTTTTRIKLLEEEIEEILKKALGFGARDSVIVDWDGEYGHFAEVVATTTGEEEPA